MATAVPNARDEKDFAKQAEIQHSYRRTTSRTMAQPSGTANLLLVTCQKLANVAANTTPKHLCDSRHSLRFAVGISVAWAGTARWQAVKAQTPQPASTERLTAKDNGVKLTDIRTLRLHFASLTIETIARSRWSWTSGRRRGLRAGVPGRGDVGPGRSMRYRAHRK